MPHAMRRRGRSRSHATFWVLGYQCTIRKNPFFGTLMGYVDVPHGHPWYGKGYAALEDEGVLAHGGLTFSAPAPHSHVARRLGFPPPWRVGFDCGNGGLDGIPMFQRRAYRDALRVRVVSLEGREIARATGLADLTDPPRSPKYVADHCRILAAQARAPAEDHRKP